MEKTKVKKSKVGRPTLFKTRPESLDDFLKAVELGMSVNAACDYAGLPRSQVYKYLKMAEEPKARRECKEFSDKLKRARARCRAANLMNIYKNSKTSWQASAWLLERVFPDEYAKREPKDTEEKEDGKAYIDNLKGFNK